MTKSSVDRSASRGAGIRKAMPRPADQEYNTTAWSARARVGSYCHGYRCRQWINRGQLYARLVAFPGHDVVGGDRPWVMKVCERCYTEHGKSMPPTQAQRRAALHEHYARQEREIGTGVVVQRCPV